MGAAARPGSVESADAGGETPVTGLEPRGRGVAPVPYGVAPRGFAGRGPPRDLRCGTGQRRTGTDAERGQTRGGLDSYGVERTTVVRVETPDCERILVRRCSSSSGVATLTLRM
ncbi:hypothetical protein A4G23_00672 [Streptomyces rubrolavendulae]|uniref:Uncharacterized protein n=1 Tax=Streptomyces rubrolavendulae TaxID=285473 RepID=A0A1D8FXK1_9ACTN|nr:hypothetical protein A4G23_00672 [Streptomyces rubrolavendulae]